MYKYTVLYYNHLNNEGLKFTIKASGQMDATEKAIQYVYKKIGLNDRLLNNYKIERIKF